MAINLRWEAAALERRLEYVASLKQSLERPDSVAAQAVAAYSDLIDGARAAAPAGALASAPPLRVRSPLPTLARPTMQTSCARSPSRSTAR
jgi:hypothetical protein